MKKTITVIIPTYNRAETLRKCLKALAAQTFPASGAEVLVVDDGSGDNTEEVAASFIKEGAVETKYLRQENKGPAAARNLGSLERSTASGTPKKGDMEW